MILCGGGAGGGTVYIKQTVEGTSFKFLMRKSVSAAGFGAADAFTSDLLSSDDDDDASLAVSTGDLPPAPHLGTYFPSFIHPSVTCCLLLFLLLPLLGSCPALTLSDSMNDLLDV